MSRKNFKLGLGISIDSYPIPSQYIQATIKSNSATTIDTIALADFNAIEYNLTIKQASKIRTSSILVQTNGTSVDTTEYAITETGGAISGVVVAASASGTDMILQVTITDAATTIARVVAEKNSNLKFTAMAPDAPTSVSAVGGTNSATISFSPPADDGGSITTYVITESITGTAINVLSSPATFSNLPGGSYTFTVQAGNENAISVPSSPSSSVTVTGAATISGGTLASDSTYYYRVFPSSGSLEISNALVNIDAFVLAGGGGGGGAYTDAGPGGGSGGLVYYANKTTAPGSYTVTVGGGGGATGNGSNSQVGSLQQAIGGGGGRGSKNNDGISGGSGSGAWGNSSTVARVGGASTQELGTATSKYGFAGGNVSAPSTNWTKGSTAGGGGTGAAGGNNDNNAQGGAGGNGTDAFSSLLSAITSSMTGVSGWGTATSGGRIGGGGAGHTPNYPQSDGGLGGGGKGGSNSHPNYRAPVSGVTNTGSGGGGGNSFSGMASGASGLVIIRYTKIQVGG
jgi:hypothetical protein